MSFAAIGLLGLLGLAVPLLATVVGIYLLKQKPRRVVVSNVELWLRAAQTAAPRVLAARRIPWLALLLSLIVALLLLAELGDPRFGQGVRGTTEIVVAAGQSMAAAASEDASDDSRLARASAEAERWAERATSAGELVVIRAGIRPDIVQSVNVDAAGLASALRERGTDDGPSNVRDALDVADRIIRTRAAAATDGDDQPAGGQIILITDHPDAHVTAAPLVSIPVGDRADTLAITRLVARRDPRALGEYRVRCEVRSFAAQSAETRLVIRDRDQIIVSQPLALEAGSMRAIDAQGFAAATAELHAELVETRFPSSFDALASDDRAYAVAPAIEPLRVLLATDGNRFLETVLGAHPAIALDVTDAAGLPSQSATGRHDLLILDRLPAPATTTAAVMLIDPPNDVAADAATAQGQSPNGFVRESPVDRPPITATLASHEALGGVHFEGTRIASAAPIHAAPGDEVLLRSGAHALMVARERGDSRVLAVAFALADTDLVSRPAFPLWMDAAMRWLAGPRSAPTLASATGTALDGRGALLVTNGRGEAIESPGGVAYDTDVAGIYHLDERAAAFSSARDAAALPSGGAAPESSLTAGLPRLSILVAMLLMGLLLFEWALLHRGRLG